MLTGADVQQLKDYVAGRDAGGQRQAESTVRLHVTHSNLRAKFIEIRLDLHSSIEDVKHKLSTHCGTSAADMLLKLKDEAGNVLAMLTDNRRMLGFYSPHDGCQLHIEDVNPHSLSANGWLEDTSKVQKYIMSDLDYNSRENTYRRHKEQMRKLDPEWTAEKELCMRKGIPYAPLQQKTNDDAHMAEVASSIHVGSRCEVAPGGKRGIVRYVGQCEGLPKGYWIGVQYDEPMGKNDGSIKGHRYFESPEGYGSFLRPNLVTTGDYPPIDEFSFSDGDEI